MPIGPAYWTDSVRDPSQAKASAAFKRILPAGPWQFFNADWNGAHGVAATWTDNKDGACPLESFGTPRKIEGGSVYFSPKVMPEQIDLGRKDYINGIEYVTSRNVNITIPYAAFASMEVSFSSMALGDPADEFATLAQNIWDRRENVKLRDPDLLRLIYLAISQNYRVTPELLDDLKWLTSKDIDPIYCCIMGLDPKVLADEVQKSLSAASA